MPEPSKQNDQTELDALRRENHELRRMIHALTKRDFKVDREELLSQIGTRGDFVEYLDSLMIGSR